MVRTKASNMPIDAFGNKLVIKGSIKKPMSLSRLGMVLQQQGFKSKRIGKMRTRGWIVRERDAEEINANRRIYGREIDQ